MRRFLRHISYCMAVLACGCSADSRDVTAEEPAAGSGALRIIVRSNTAVGTRANDLYDNYLHLNDEFTPYDSHIFLYNTGVATPIPDFRSAEVYDYVCQPGLEYYKDDYYNVFVPDESSAEISVGSLGQDAEGLFALDALYYPNVKDKADIRFTYTEGSTLLRGSVNGDQTDYPHFASNDLMLAHDLIPHTEVNDPVRLTFYHMMSMVVVNINVPLDDDPFGQGFGLNSLKWCRLPDRALDFHVDYNTKLSSDAMHTLVTESDGVRDIIRMCRLDKQDEPIVSRGARNSVQSYRFSALVPPESLGDDVSKVFCRFGIELEPAGRGERTFDLSVADTKGAILRSGYVTELDVTLTPERPKPIDVSVRVLPWRHAYTVDFDLKEQQ